MAKSVVLVEDDEHLQEVLVIALEDAGLKVFCAADGVEGLELIRKRIPDGVILDIMMPRMNGYEVCAALQSDEKTREIPILVLTAVTEDDGPEEDAAWRDRMGVADFISKPFGTRDIVERVLATISGNDT